MGAAPFDLSLLEGLLAQGGVAKPRSVPSAGGTYIEPPRSSITKSESHTNAQEKLSWVGAEILPDDPLYDECPWGNENEETVSRQEQIKACFEIAQRFMLEHDRPQTMDDWQRISAEIPKLPYNRLISELVIACVEFWEQEWKDGVTHN